MDAFHLRRTRDLGTVFDLQRRYPDLLDIRATCGNPVDELELAFRIPTAVDRAFPRRRRPACRARLTIPFGYPAEPAQVTMADAVFNPNVFPSGLLCPGQVRETTWTLGDLVWRTMRILALDPEIINTLQPANPQAAAWYRRALPTGIFPSLQISERGIASGAGITFRELRPDAHP